MLARHVLLAATLVPLALPAPACTLKMALEQWPPYSMMDARSGPAGLDLELLRAIAGDAGCTLQMLPELPPARRQLLFRQGSLNLQLAASDTPERRAYARFSLPYRHETVGIFTTPARYQRFRQIDSFDAIARLRATLLAPRVGWYGADYARHALALEAGGLLSTFSNFPQGLRMLAAGRAELIMGDTVALRYAARRQGVELVALPLAPLRAPVHLMLHAASTSAADLAAIDGAITRLEQRGTLEAIRSRYSER